MQGVALPRYAERVTYRTTAVPGPAELLYALTGQADPMRQLQMQLAGQVPGQQPGPQGPQGPQPQGAQPAAPGADQSAPIAPGQQVQGAQPQPQAYQSSPDMSASFAQLASPQGNNLMSLYMQAQQRAYAGDQINRGLALIAANHAGNPGMARAIMQSVEGGSPGPGGMMGDLMQIYNFQYAQQQRAAFEQSLPELSQQTGLPINILRMEGPQGAAALVERMQQAKMPPAGVQWEHDQFIKGGGTEEEWQRDYLPMIISRGMTTPDPVFNQMRVEGMNWRQQHPDEPLPDRFRDTGAFADFKDLQKKQRENADKAPALDGSLVDLEGKIGEITNPDNKGALTALISQGPVLRGLSTGELASTLGLSDPKQVHLYNTLRDLQKMDYAGMTSQNPNAADDLFSIHNNLPALLNFNEGYEGVTGTAAQIAKNIQRARANNFGRSGLLDKVDSANLDDAVDASYLPGGRNFVGDAKKLDAASIENFRAAVKADVDAGQDPAQVKAKYIRQLKVQGYDTRSLEAQ